VRLFRVVVEGDVSRSSELFFSPDRQVAAVKVRLPDQEKLALARTDGSPPVIARAGLSGLGDPLWSPDSRLVAFTQSGQRGPVTWQIVGADGQDVWSLPPARPGAEYVWGNLAWAECPS
jgi:hypothetical protein